MSSRNQQLSEALQRALGDKLKANVVAAGEVTVEVASGDLLAVCKRLRDDSEFAFEQMIDVCGADYSEYGCTEWSTDASTHTGFSRGVTPEANARLRFGDAPAYQNTDRPRFAAVYHLLSIANNQRLRLRCYCENDAQPVLPSVIEIWASVNWYEREAFDLYGIIFEGHPDLRRILTDYGFVGHPFRKDFPLIGTVEMRYDPEQKRVIYQPVSIEPRVLVPRVIRHDSRYLNDANVSADISEAGTDNA
jgi:NADH-quinone oxidoreductase subunit C